MYACLAVTCHLHFWQNDRDFLRATGVTRGWNGYRNKSQHRKSTLEKKILPPLLQGFEPATFQSRVRCSNHWAIPAPWYGGGRRGQLSRCYFYLLPVMSSLTKFPWSSPTPAQAILISLIHHQGLEWAAREHNITDIISQHSWQFCFKSACYQLALDTDTPTLTWLAGSVMTKDCTGEGLSFTSAMQAWEN